MLTRCCNGWQPCRPKRDSWLPWELGNHQGALLWTVHESAACLWFTALYVCKRQCPSTVQGGDAVHCIIQHLQAGFGGVWGLGFGGADPVRSDSVAGCVLRANQYCALLPQEVPAPDLLLLSSAAGVECACYCQTMSDRL